jgi:L,D-transpeptidase YbiS
MEDNGYLLDISLADQKLTLKRANTALAEFPISTARNGAGERLNSECTPRGRHRIAEKIGEGCAVDTVFVGRKPTGESYSEQLRNRHPARDWILTRILRLEGIEYGINKGGEVDTFERMIYIHGSPADVQMGVAGSHGCIRMRNQDVIKLFDMVPIATEVFIHD